MTLDSGHGSGPESEPPHAGRREVPDRYLGDGVYASFDGYQIWLDTRAQVPVNRIALEPPVLAALDVFRSAVNRILEEQP